MLGLTSLALSSRTVLRQVVFRRPFLLLLVGVHLKATLRILSLGILWTLPKASHCSRTYSYAVPHWWPCWFSRYCRPYDQPYQSERDVLFHFTKFLFQVPLFSYSPSQPFLFLKERCVTRQKTALRRRGVLGAKMLSLMLTSTMRRTLVDLHDSPICE